MIDVRFSTALQVMLSLMLAEREGIVRVSSTQLAVGLGANPSLVRKLLVPLAQCGLVSSSMGKNGGVRLAKSPDGITLAEVYIAATAGKTLLAARSDYAHRCIVSSNFEAHFLDVTGTVEATLLSELGQRSLSQSFAELERLEAGRQGGTTITGSTNEAD